MQLPFSTGVLWVMSECCVYVCVCYLINQPCMPIAKQSLQTNTTLLQGCGCDNTLHTHYRVKQSRNCSLEIPVTVFYLKIAVIWLKFNQTSSYLSK